MHDVLHPTEHDAVLRAYLRLILFRARPLNRIQCRPGFVDQYSKRVMRTISERQKNFAVQRTANPVFWR